MANVFRFARVVAKPIVIPLQIARSGLGLLRDVNLGLRPLIAGLDSVVDRGSRLEVIRRSFQSLTGQSGKNAEIMANQIVRAASGTLRMAEAMALANRSLGTMKFDELLTAVEFVSKKSVATGKNPTEALNTVITGLIRGSTLFLDDFGILVDGVDGVRRSYDAIKGSGAFDSLGPAAQKAETIRQALAEMRGQIDKIGVSGKSSFFLWQGIKNQIGDSVDRLVLAVAKSDALKSALSTTANLFRGLSDHFFAGKSATPFQDVLFGKVKKDSRGNTVTGDDGEAVRGGGLLGVLGAGLMDLGEIVGRGVLGGLLKGLSLLPDIFTGIWEGLKTTWDILVKEIPPAIEEGLKWLKTEFLPAFKKTMMELLGDIIDLFPTSLIPEDLRKMWDGLKKRFGRNPQTRPPEDRTPSIEQPLYGEDGTPLIAPPARLLDRANRAMGGGPAGTIQGFLAQVASASVMGPSMDDGTLIKQRNLFQLFGDSADALLSGGVLGGDSRIAKAFGDFNNQFSKPGSAQRVAVKPNPDGLELTPTRRFRLKEELKKIERQKEAIERGVGLKGEARRLANEETKALREQGYRVTERDRDRIYQRHLKRLQDEAREGLEKDEGEIREQLRNDRDLRKAHRRQRENNRKPMGGPGPVKSDIERKAQRLANDEIKAMREKGERVTFQDRDRIYRRHLQKLREEARGGGGADDDRQAGAGGGADIQGQGNANGVTAVKSPTIEEKLDSLIARVDSVGAALGMADARIAAVGGRRS